MALYYSSLVAAILLGIAGQIALKSAANVSATIITQFLNPLTMIGLAVYVFAALCYILALKKIPVSIAFPSVAASYAIHHIHSLNDLAENRVASIEMRLR